MANDERLFSRRRLPRRKSVFNVLADAVDVEDPNALMIVDRGLLRWAMVMARTAPETAIPSSKRETEISPLRRHRLLPPTGA